MLLYQGFRALLGEANAHLMKPVGNAGDSMQQSLNFRLTAPNHAQAAPFVINCGYLFLITPPPPSHVFQSQALCRLSSSKVCARLSWPVTIGAAARRVSETSFCGVKLSPVTWIVSLSALLYERGVAVSSFTARDDMVRSYFTPCFMPDACHFCRSSSSMCAICK
jgi:hypothetical protein